MEIFELRGLLRNGPPVPTSPLLERFVLIKLTYSKCLLDFAIKRYCNSLRVIRFSPAELCIESPATPTAYMQ